MRLLRIGPGACIMLMCMPVAYAQQDVGSNSSYSQSNSSSRSRSNRSNSFDTGTGTDSLTDFGGSSRNGSRSSRRSRNSTPTPTTGARGTGTPAPGSKATPGTGKELKSAAGKKAPSGPKSGGGGGEGRAATNVEFKMKADPSTNLIYIEGMGAEPTMNILVTEGEEFVTRAFYVNARGTAYKTFTVALKYDPAIMRPVGIDDSDLASLLEDEASAHIDERRGILTYKATLAQPSTDPATTVFKVQWKALAPTSDAAISFINNDKFRSNVLDSENRNVLVQRDETGEIESSQKAGLVDAAVSVMPSAKTARTLSDEEGSFSAISLVNNISAGTAEGGIQLELRPRRQNVRVGEDFLVDINFSNPRHAELDTMKLKMRFDPAVLQVVDYDNDNWITTGINVYDGDYHDDLPFDYHRRNNVSNATGVIEYDMGFAARVRIPVAGTIATIRMRAVAPATSTSIAFVYEDGEDAESQTAVSFLGFNLVGSPGQRAAALRNVDVSVSKL